MELRGNNISLACFHGINFKSKSWALFSLKEPCINFNTESQEIPSTAATGELLFMFSFSPRIELNFLMFQKKLQNKTYT